MAAAKACPSPPDADLIGINHLEGHIWANFLEHGPPDPPYVALVVSGGHTMIVHMPELFRYDVLGQTLDDAAGEAFDKVARLMGLGFPGGPALDAMSRDGNPTRSGSRGPWRLGDFDFSMSGLKTAVLRHVKAERAAGRDIDLPDLAASFQEAIVDVQVPRRSRRPGAGVARCCWVAASWRTCGCASGWSATGAQRGSGCCTRPSITVTDNAAMIACVGAARLARGERTSLDIGADPNLGLAS